jgi:hypothetical protein
MARRNLIWAMILLCGAFVAATSRQANIIASTQEGALAALNHIEEWAKWMTGVQTAALAVLAFILFEKDSVNARPLPQGPTFFAFSAFLLLGVGLLLSAWIFSSISSHALRVYALTAEGPDARYDIYEDDAFGWTVDIPLGYILSAAHWLWAVGLICMGASVTQLLFRRAG